MHPSTLARQAYDNAKSIKNKSQAAVLAAIVFLACRHTGNARTFKEICAVVPQASVKVGGGWVGWRHAVVPGLRAEPAGLMLWVHERVCRALCHCMSCRAV